MDITVFAVQLILSQSTSGPLSQTRLFDASIAIWTLTSSITKALVENMRLYLELEEYG